MPVYVPPANPAGIVTAKFPDVPDIAANEILDIPDAQVILY